MFDADTANLLRSAPKLPGMNADDLPAILTAHYANLASGRLRGAEASELSDEDAEWSLERIADTYELIASVHQTHEHRSASAFVAGTAQQIIARRQEINSEFDKILPNIDRSRLDPRIAAAILFLMAEQYADANEAGAAIRVAKGQQIYEADILAENISDLSQGRLTSIIDRSNRWRRSPRQHSDFEQRALAALLETLNAGIEIFVCKFLQTDAPESLKGRFNNSTEAFQRVIELSVSYDSVKEHPFSDAIVTYAGPHHLASLLLAATDSIGSASLLSVPPPAGSDPEVWKKWLRFRAEKCPYLWPNHRKAVEKGFHETGISSVVVLPTGAGKTTISSLKIAGALARGKKVVFLAPTHALVDQLTEDLQDMFPKDIFGSMVSNDFDMLLLDEANFKEIEVMTPERCLTMLSFAPETFKEVGLLVFDECHLLNPEPGKIRRALDGMLCILGFVHVSPKADLLFLSAMINNGDDVSKWIGKITDRDSVSVDLVWKPSRQARGVIIYDKDHLAEIQRIAQESQRKENVKKRKVATSVRAAALKHLFAHPFAIWGLQHNWLSDNSAMCIFSQLLSEPVQIAASLRDGFIHLTPNANEVAVRLAAAAAKNGLKTIIFVNSKMDAVGVANDISDSLEDTVEFTESEQRRWEALGAELGGYEHSLLSGSAAAVPHNSAMLQLERGIAERMFKRKNGSKVIVATPTLAQGLNLPAHLAIIAGDKRADIINGRREVLKAHEILNAAARAGRAGHLANGLVLMIPEPIISFRANQPIDRDVLDKLKSLLPEDDHCVTISDPIEKILDLITSGAHTDPDVRYMISRMTVLRDSQNITEPSQFFDLQKSLGAYVSILKSEKDKFDQKIDILRRTVDEQAGTITEEGIAILASRSGLSVFLIIELKDKIFSDIGSLPTSVEGWIDWTVKWLSENDDARDWLLRDISRNILGACGKSKNGLLLPEDISHILPGLQAWVRGEPIKVIEELLGGTPDSHTLTKRTCPRARELVVNVIPRGFSFILSLISQVVIQADPFDRQTELDRDLVECLGSAVRKGFDSVDKLYFANGNKDILSRVEVHRAFMT